MGACASVEDAPPEGGELSRLADQLVKYGCQRSSVNDALRVFWRADKDGSGTIGLREFASMFGLRASNAFLPRMLALFDVSGDGDIGALEFVLYLAQFYGGSASAHLYFSWRLFDQDDSGSLTIDEFEKIAKNELSYTGSANGYNAGKEHASTPGDTIGDRVVMSGRMGKKVKVKGLKRILEDMDMDKNGKITIDEFKVISANLTHILAPAFELWSAMEKYAKPCWKLKEELKESGHLNKVLAMLGNNRLVKSLSKRVDPAQKRRGRELTEDLKTTEETRPQRKSEQEPGTGTGDNRRHRIRHHHDDREGNDQRREDRHHRERHHRDREAHHREDHRHADRRHRHKDGQRDRDRRRGERHHRHADESHHQEREQPQYYGNPAVTGTSHREQPREPFGYEGYRDPGRAPPGRVRDHQDDLLAQLERDMYG